MGYIIKNTSGLINTRLTDTARLKISQGTFNIAYFQVGDSEVSYNTLPSNTYSQFNTFILEPSFNAQNSSGVPQSNKENIKYPIYVDGTTGNTYGIPFMDSSVSPVFNRAAMRGFFTGNTTATTISWSALTNSDYVINSNYTIQMNTLIGTNQMTLTFDACDTNVVRGFAIGDFVTIIYDGEGSNTCNCVNVVTPTPTPTISVTPSVTATPGASPTPSSTNPCLSPTPTPTPSATFCPTPTPSNACSVSTKPNCTVKTQGCYPILTYRIVDVCLNTITLDRNTPDYSYLGSDCYARVIVYPPNMTTIYDSITPSPHWNDSVINFESVCYTDQFDVKIWNMNIPWSESPAGLDSGLYKDYTSFGSLGYLGSKEYFGYASSSGQTTTTPVYFNNSFGEPVIVRPEEQKAIAIVHYTNQTIDLFYGEKFALEPFNDEFDDTTGQARNFRLHIPSLMWHKNPECCFGETFYVDPPNFDGLNLFTTRYIKSSKNPDMNNPGLRYYNLWDTHANPVLPSRIGKVFPDSKIIVIDDEEVIAAMSYKSNRNWTLPAPKLTLITPNTCGDLTNSVDGILSANTEYLYVTYRLSNSAGFTNSLHCNYYIKIGGPNLSCNSEDSQNVGVRFGGDFNCLSSNQTGVGGCWFTGFTFWFLPDPISSPDFYVSYPFVKTPQSLNGYPIFRTLIENGGIYNIYFDGTNWMFRFNSIVTDQILNFTNNGPIDDFTLETGSGVITGYTECSENSILCLTTCEENLSCVNETYYKVLSGSTEFYLPSSFDTDYRMVYNSPDWEVYSASTRIGLLTGLTQNDLPIGTWTPDILSVTGLTTSLFENCISIGCQSFTAQTTGVQSVIKTVDCNFVISDDLTGTTFSGCVVFIDNLFDSSVIKVSGTTNVGSGTSICTATTATTAVCSNVCEVNSGFFANTFEIICQKVVGNGRPEPSEWKIIDYTDQLTGTTTNGLLTASGITGNTFVITQDLYNDAPFYDLNDYISLTPQGFSGSQLNFGDEYYFYGNLETDIQATIYEMRYKINLSQSEFLTSSNPTWSTNTTPYMTEVGLYDSDKNLMIISKLQSPVLRQGVQQLLVKFDF